MIHRQNVRQRRGEDGVFLVTLDAGQGSALDIGPEGSVQVEIRRMGALSDESPLLTLQDSDASQIEKVAASGQLVSFRWRVNAAASLALPCGDYIWEERSSHGGLVTHTIGGVLEIA